MSDATVDRTAYSAALHAQLDTLTRPKTRAEREAEDRAQIERERREAEERFAQEIRSFNLEVGRQTAELVAEGGGWRLAQVDMTTLSAVINDFHPLRDLARDDFPKRIYAHNPLGPTASSNSLVQRWYLGSIANLLGDHPKRENVEAMRRAITFHSPKILSARW
ncbi:MAG: hypothetical protein ACKVQT_12100 [Burkholderiales bacterium]